MMTFLMQAISNPGEMGTATNILLQSMVNAVNAVNTNQLAELIGEPLPSDALLPGDYMGPSRIIVPVVRTLLGSTEDFTLKVRYGNRSM